MVVVVVLAIFPGIGDGDIDDLLLTLFYLPYSTDYQVPTATCGGLVTDYLMVFCSPIGDGITTSDHLPVTWLPDDDTILMLMNMMVLVIDDCWWWWVTTWWWRRWAWWPDHSDVPVTLFSWWQWPGGGNCSSWWQWYCWYSGYDDLKKPCSLFHYWRPEGRATNFWYDSILWPVYEILHSISISNEGIPCHVMMMVIILIIILASINGSIDILMTVVWYY